MTWDTPLGLRTLSGMERKVIGSAICNLSREIIEGELGDSAQVGVAVFDAHHRMPAAGNA